MSERTECGVCFRHCKLEEGQTGFCGARVCRDGKVTAKNYGAVSSLALDPIEKKPLSRFFPGSMILSAGSFGCNLRCPFCQNHTISWSDEAVTGLRTADIISPERLADIAVKCRDEGNIGLAFTYNEPLVGYEFVRDTARLIHKRGMKNVLVTNGTAELSVLEELLPYIDAMNIDLKSFSEQTCHDILGGDLGMVKDFIELAVKHCHVEITTLVVTGLNDTDEELNSIVSWIAGLTDSAGKVIGSSVPFHISRFFPRFRMTDRKASDVRKIYRFAEAAREKLKYVYTGNC